MEPCLPVTPKNCLPRRGISILEKLIKTCPVWLQLGLGQAETARILHRETVGVSQGLFISWPLGRYSHKELPGTPTEADPICLPFLGVSAFQPG